MRTIHQLFHAPQNDKLRDVELKHNRKTLCWYPSAGEDLRHIEFLEAEGLARPKRAPLLYVHTDIRKPHFLNQTSPIVLPDFEITNIVEIHLKHPFLDVSDICSFDADENIGKSFLVELTKHLMHNDRHVTVYTNVVYIIAENLTFFVKFILLHNLQVDMLVHIRDGGGSLGGSFIPMNFIYQATHLIKLKRVISDMSVAEKYFDSANSHDVLTRQCEKIPKFHHYVLDQFTSRSDDEIKSQWRSKPIPQFPKYDHNDCDDANNEYHYWKPARV